MLRNATALERELIELLGSVLERSGDFDIGPDVALRDAGVPSVAFIAFLNAIEAQYSVEWDEDIPPGGLRCIASIAEIVEQQQGKGA